MAIFQQQPIVTDHPFVALQNHSQHVPPYQFQRAGGGGGAPPPSNQFLFNWNQSHGGGGGVIIDSITFFWGGGEGGGGWRALSFDISILSRGQINFEPTPIFVNKNSSFALPELAFVTVGGLQMFKTLPKCPHVCQLGCLVFPHGFGFKNVSMKAPPLSFVRQTSKTNRETAPVPWSQHSDNSTDISTSIKLNVCGREESDATSGEG